MDNSAVSNHPGTSCHPSNGGELSPQRERNKSPFTTDGVLPQYHRGASSSSSGGVARVSVPGWSNPHRPQFGQHTPVTRTHQCPPHQNPPTQTLFARGPVWGRGVSSRAMTGGGVIRAPPCHCEGARNVENVVVRLRQSSAICLRASARSAFLFTESPRSARDDKGD